jgi:hypothetical protein
MRRAALQQKAKVNTSAYCLNYAAKGSQFRSVNLVRAKCSHAGAQNQSQQAQSQREVLPFEKIPKAKGYLPLLGNTMEVLRDLPHLHLIVEKHSTESDVLRVIFYLSFLFFIFYFMLV